MAYSDYGGYAYRNGSQVDDRSDAVITPDLANIGSPGVYPGFVAIASGSTPEAFEKTRQAAVDGHVVLGDGPVLVSLYKQSTLQAFVLRSGEFTKVDLLESGVDLPAAAVSEWQGKKSFSGYNAAEADAGVCRFQIAGHVLEAVFEDSDNYYQYARLTQPDGTVWTGFSGYGVGMGLEDCGYGFSTRGCERRLAELFPASADTHPQGGDSAQTEAPAPLSGAVPSEETADAQTTSHRR